MGDLSWIKSVNPDIRWLFVVRQRESQVVYTVDSVATDSAEWCPPGRIFSNPPPAMVDALRGGPPAVVGPYAADRWGTLISCFVPMTGVGSAATVLAIDFDGSVWEFRVARVRRRVLIGLLPALLLYVVAVAFVFVRRRAARAIQATEKNYRLIAENMTDLILLHDPQTFRYLYVSPSVKAVLGYEVAEVMALSPEQLTHPDDVVSVLRPAQQQAGRPAPFAIPPARVRHKDGRWIWIETFVRPICDAEGRTVQYLSAARDVTQHKQTEDALQRAKEAAEAANNAKNHFLACMSHEMRTPMTVIIGFVQLLRRGPLSVEQLNQIDLIMASAKSLLGIINDLLDFSKVEAGVLNLVKQPFVVGDMIRSVVAAQEMAASSKGLRIVVEKPESLPRFIGDEERMRQVLLNLIGNAIKFTEAGHITLSVEYQALGPREGVLDLAVTDTGIGIDPADHERIFAAFIQVDVGRKRKFGGTGLGLAISKALVETMGGRIKVESTLGHGARFSFALRLPLVDEK